MNHCMHVVAYYEHRAAGNVCEDGLLAAIYEMDMNGRTPYGQQFGRAFRVPPAPSIILDFDNSIKRHEKLK